MRKTFDLLAVDVDPETGRDIGEGVWYCDLKTLEIAIRLAESLLKSIYGEKIPAEWETSELDYGELMHHFYDTEKGISIAIYENDIDMVNDKFQEKQVPKYD